MSSCLKKVLGYGLIDLEPGDARINWDSPLLDFTAAPSFTDFAGHLDTVTNRESGWLVPVETVRGIGAAHPRRTVDECVVHNAETGSPKVLVLLPPSQAGDWLRSEGWIKGDKTNLELATF